MKYQFLSKDAKERARQWWIECESQDWRFEDYYDELIAVLKLLGFTVDYSDSKRSPRYLDPNDPRGRTHREYDIQWSGFYSQGDGLVFKGSWDAEDLCLGKLMEEWPQDKGLHRIGAQLQAIALKHPKGTCDVTNVNYGPGLPGVHIEEASTGEESEDGDNEEMDDAEQDVLKECVRDICDWCFNMLRDYYESDTSEETAAESIKANDYDFDRDGDIMIRRARTTRTGYQVSATT